MSRSTPSDVLRLPAKEAPVLAAMKELSAQHPRYGYRRIRVFLGRKGFELRWSRTHQLWYQAGLPVPRKRSRKRIASARLRIHVPIKANMVWRVGVRGRVHEPTCPWPPARLRILSTRWNRRIGSARHRHRHRAFAGRAVPSTKHLVHLLRYPRNGQ